MNKYPHIDAFYQVAKYATKRGIGKVQYEGTVKLHGTNGGVKVTVTGEVTCQSHNRKLSVENDNYGFAKWVLNTPERVAFFREEAGDYLDLYGGEEVTFFGEFIGAGINHGCAIHQLPDKQFVLFNVLVGETLRSCGTASLPEFNIYNVSSSTVFVVTVDFNHPELSVDTLNMYTLEVENECPWGKKFGVSGLGEGIVWKPVNPLLGSELFFKTKGDKHKYMKSTLARAKAPVTENTLDFVKQFVTVEVLEQGIDYLKEMGKALDRSSTGDYLAFVCSDVARESADTLEANGLTWKQVNGLVSTKARQFFFDYIG